MTEEQFDDRTLLLTVLFDIRKDGRRIADAVDDDEEAEEDEEDS